MAKRFSVLYFFQYCSDRFQLYFHPGSSSSPCNSFSILYIDSTFPLCSFYSNILLKKCFASLPLHPVVGLSSCILDLLVEFSFVILECVVFICIA